ncbi:sugar ABC transporter substrate-binding protein [Jatrophihabitans telluris]|uniref:Sugar ABC transporter substrate-binding protein n=1 Tax=Jatrophihabitans telluris TaxID=2038343 RepID=A0ABY4QX30_9ACTN|nr:sugar ABC transporter substrate-binding protein [Jatrophihabitans telluris]UQX87576.1 sugar ABC transporter substrate-binding protein [Jatrophihabitans telluris]
MRSIRVRTMALIGVTATAAGLLTACSGAGGGGSSSGGSKSINVLMVGNSQMTDIQKLTADNFTKDSGIKVNFTVLDENSLRAKVQDDVANKTGAFDVVTIGAYEVPIWSKNGWLHEVSSYSGSDSEFDQADILKPMLTAASGSDGKLYGIPFYGESSMLMYRKDLLQAKGITMPEHPTWQQVADAAAKVADKSSGMAGICLRGLKGWGEMFAPLTTVVNTMGGTWFNKDWTPQVNAAGFTKAVTFYTNLVKQYGEPDPQTSGFTECQNAIGQGKAAMWYDATSGAGKLEDSTQSKVAGKLGYAFAPVDQTKYSGWLWSWDWAMPSTTKRADSAWKFISWASSKKYENLVGTKLGWSRVPDGKRESTYSIADYQKATSGYYKIVKESIENADPANPGTQPRPAIGVQFVDVPEFADLGDKVSSYVDDVLTGASSVAAALDKGQKDAEAVAKVYQKTG